MSDVYTRQVRNHLVDFGIEGEFATGKIKRFSAGQKCRVVLAGKLTVIKLAYRMKILIGTIVFTAWNAAFFSFLLIYQD